MESLFARQWVKPETTQKKPKLIRWAIAAELFGCALWIVALFSPSVGPVEILGRGDSPGAIPGLLCFVFTFFAWLESPLTVVPLVLVNTATLLLMLFFWSDVRHGVPLFVVIGSCLLAPVGAAATLTIGVDPYLGFWIWVVSLSLLGLANGCLYLAHHQFEPSKDGAIK